MTALVRFYYEPVSLVAKDVFFEVEQDIPIMR